ncbi:Eco57I restriction-modification methylase domain-containing protein [uncultured Thiodictyon sp.]|uniref:Eco57I restriction-modification methylase domain-containing protein n=1 Tax=uncultured Thiodictyon sp. TaxID=1846217 RepID=UPI0025D08DC7|nr:Eco57I restriction-modification methylase domain-containing protein [uncultured Thiodictyon sp.]
MRAWVPRVRLLIEDEFSAQLKRLGLQPNGKHKPLDQMRLPDESVAVRGRVAALIARDAIVEGSAERGYENVKRELAYTLLNRLVGLKAMEVRQLLYLPPPSVNFHHQDTKAPRAEEERNSINLVSSCLGGESDFHHQGTKTPRAEEERNGINLVSSCLGGESCLPEQTEVITPIPGQARSRYLRDYRAAGGSKYKYDDDAEERLLRDGLTTAFRHITQDIRVLFDPDHEYACLWPTHASLVNILKTINEDLPEDAYRAQDFLGWVYQFFNREEKKRVRDENKGTPRSSYELAVINQFYTPSWVVKVLVDNTLGRLWLQMHPDSALAATAPPPLPDERTSDVPVADYLVPRTGERIRYQRLTDDGQVETFKRARDIALLDPACGTMHFGQYAFGLFHRMYLDEIEHAGQPGWPAEPSVGEPRDIPAAIIEHNLFGVDIDPRAIQIASLSLLLTAKEAALKHGYSPLDVQIHRSNLVVANAVDLGAERLKGLVARIFHHQDTKTQRRRETNNLVSSCLGGESNFHHQGTKTPRKEQANNLVSSCLGGESSEVLSARLFKVIWGNLQYVSELGSLVQVREGVERVLDDWVETRAREKGLTRVFAPAEPRQLELGSILADLGREQARQFQLERRLLEAEARQLQQELLAAIEDEAAQVGGDPAERLFAEDTARGLKLLQILSRHYDVVVMNPPYGAFIPKVKDFVKAAYPLTANDIYAAFIDRATQLTEPDGYVGALVSATFINLTSFEKLRTEILLKRNPLITMLDLGFGILDDATVEAAAIVLRGGVR